MGMIGEFAFGSFSELQSRQQGGRLSLIERLAQFG